MPVIEKMHVKICPELIDENTLRIPILPVDENVADVFSAIDLAEGRAWGQSSLTITEDGEYALAPFTVKVAGQAITVLRSGRVVQALTLEDRGISFPLGSSRIYGLGHGYKLHPNRRGGVYDLRVDGQVPGIIQNHGATSAVGYVIGSEGWALYFHQPWKGCIDLTGDAGRFTVPELLPAQYADIFVAAFDHMADAARAYYRLTGLPPMPPKYALGYQQSYRTLVHEGENEVLKTARYMRKHDLPCDLLIYLGSGYCEHGWNSMNGNFDFDPLAFPDPEGMMEELHALGYKVSLHITKCHTGLHGRVGDENVSPLEYDHARNYWQVHERLYQRAKNECWWPDDADEVDLRQRLARHRMYYEGSLLLNPDLRPFQMQRNACAGHTKWGAAIWTGDVLSEWETFRNQIAIGLNAGLSCSPYWGTDTGGFFCTEEYTGELFLRWFQFSAFTPFFRGHGRPSYLHNPWGWTQHTWEHMPLERRGEWDGLPPRDSLPDDRVEPICRKYLHLRYALLPYLYTLFHEASASGTPIMRPLWFHDAQDETAAALSSEYLLGDSLLVAPVTSKGAESWPVYLPRGQWYNYWTDEIHEGCQWIETAAPLDTLPLFVRAGSVLPFGPVTQHVETNADDFDALCLKVYPGASAAYELYEDDGLTLGYQRGEHTATLLRWHDDTASLAAEGRSERFSGCTRVIPYEVAGGQSGTLEVVYQPMNHQQC